MADLLDIDDWVEEAASLPIKSFYPTAVANATGLPLDVVFNRLLRLFEDKKIDLLYEIRCPEYECARVIKTVKDFSEVELYQQCSIHGEFEINPDLIFPVFYINQDYKKRIIKKRKKPSSIKSNAGILTDFNSSPAPVTEMLPQEINNLLGQLEGSKQVNFINIYCNGDVKMSEFKIGKIENNQGSLAMGDHSNSSFVNNGSAQGLEDITRQLIELIKQNQDMPNDTKDELTEVVC
ncbi:hypothetical protein B7C51_20570 [Paenibacillus larvae subsp. pulvifaciens]|uniref:Uncharacterized protein n=1 Tax=Paenibacillus larvae subsp. pulvifaciens TaxID=1477 RepID=A0A1V0UWE9_9BACL|nr:hypothetical protein [Paenibacillus larvae]ARF69543.1 hypothetical protein B7C51_19525 [Paenibacillus larvae subsp. pulvifaciens]ARF69719.1 hypothetical protein B7C51_20570 [Paenibacillus larvae subsp. pulvifaciens]